MVRVCTQMIEDIYDIETFDDAEVEEDERFLRVLQGGELTRAYSYDELIWFEP